MNAAPPKRVALRQTARAAARQAATDRSIDALLERDPDGAGLFTPNRQTRRAIERAPMPSGTNVERQNRSDARPKNARKLAVRARRQARMIERSRAERYGEV